jgi:hypothetical protein
MDPLVAAALFARPDDDPTKSVPVKLDPDSRSIRVNVWVYNTTTLAWERMKQPTLELTGDLTVTLGDVERLLADQYYQRGKTYTHASGRVKYVCRNTDIDANETDTDWFCWLYSDADVPDWEGPRQGAVNTEGTVDALFA